MGAKWRRRTRAEAGRVAVLGVGFLMAGLRRRDGGGRPAGRRRMTGATVDAWLRPFIRQSVFRQAKKEQMQLGNRSYLNTYW